MEEMVAVGSDCSILGLEADSVPTGAGNVNVNRLLTDISSVNEFYGLPKSRVNHQVKKKPSTPFGDFNKTIYKPKVLYEGLGKDKRYLIYWDNKINNDIVFDHIKCSISDNIKAKAAPDEEPPLHIIIQIYLMMSCITIQSLDHKWFLSTIFPKVKNMFNSLFLLSPTSIATLPISPAISPSRKLINDLFVTPLVSDNYKTPAPSHIHQPVSSVTSASKT